MIGFRKINNSFLGIYHFLRSQNPSMIFEAKKGFYCFLTVFYEFFTFLCKAVYFLMILCLKVVPSFKTICKK